MLSTARPLVIAIFKEESQAKEVIEVLRNAQFQEEQIGIVVLHDNTAIRRLNQEEVRLGVPEEDVERYMRELEAGNKLVWVRHEGRYWETANILHSDRIQRLSISKRSDIPDWQKLLMDAGIDRLLDELP